VRGRWISLSTLAIAIAWPGAAAAYRPFDSTDGAVAASGEAEIELGFGWLGQPGARELVAPQLRLNLGFVPRMEAVLEGSSIVPVGPATDAARYRLDDTALSLKAVLREGVLQDRPGPSVATEVGMLLPTYSGERGVGATAALIVSERWAPVTIHVNGEAILRRSGALGAFGGLIVEGPDAWTVRPVGEVFVAGERGAAAEVSGLLGAIWQVSPSLALDMAARQSVRGHVTTREVRMGLTWGFAVWSRP
jgi:hypothetical protein